ncbi:hypothetical protein Pmani_019279 [Petrolisthes manimaculis]|uniref:Uncharacterized protein n=1 Tax=Petrolisthes manimaculis TaxID=1843537 RepID=A0AAE1PL45_9EUCA|nr:hypothetical protein Pmani_019279 [Petrolisthes manimaculis]
MGDGEGRGGDGKEGAMGGGQEGAMRGGVDESMGERREGGGGWRVGEAERSGAQRGRSEGSWELVRRGWDGG